MSSPTKQTEMIRTKKSRTKGKKARSQRQNQGTTLSKADLFGDKD